MVFKIAKDAYTVLFLIGSITTLFSTLPLLGMPLIFPFVVLKYIVLGSSLNIITGFTGYANFGHVVFYGLGVYWAALSIWHIGSALFDNPYLAVMLSGLGNALVALTIGAILLRLRGAYFALAMLSFNEVIKLSLLNLPTEWTGGTHGIPIPGIYNPISAYYGMALLAALVLVFTYFISVSSFGVCLKAIREDEDVAESMGIPTLKYKLVAFILSGAIAGFAGGLDFWFTSYASPEINFELHNTIEYFVVMLLGGAGTVFGPVIGSIVLFSVRDILWAISPFLYLVIFGGLIVLLMLFMPYGILGLLERSSRFKGKIK